MQDGLILTHGAGSNGDAPLLKALDAVFEQAGFRVIRHTLDFRVRKPNGPPHPKDAEADRAGLYDEVIQLRRDGCDRVYVGGHSYGGRQATIMASEHPGLIAGLLLLSYPLHPPEKPDQLRTAHFPQLRTPSLFVHGGKDGFGTAAEMQNALELIPGRTELMMIENAGHDLGKNHAAIAKKCFDRFKAFND